MRLVTILAVLAVVLFAGLSSVDAQSAPAEIEVVSERAIDETGGSLTALVDGVSCDTISLSDGNRLLRLGLPDQPESCGVEGATVTFINALGQELSESLPVRLGQRQELLNLAPAPPGSGVPSPPSAGSGGMTDASADSVPFVAALIGLAGLAIGVGLARHVAR